MTSRTPKIIIRTLQCSSLNQDSTSGVEIGGGGGGGGAGPLISGHIPYFWPPIFLAFSKNQCSKYVYAGITAFGPLIT